MKRGALIWVIAGGVAVLVVAAVAVWWFTSRPQTADAAASAYLAALESGDLPKIEAMLASPVDEAVGAAFGSADSYIADPSVASVVAGADGTVRVRAEAELAGERRALEFLLTSTDGRWLLSPNALGTVRLETMLAGVPGGGDSAWIGDTLVTTDTDIALLPGVYTVDAAPRGILSGRSSAVVVGGDLQTLTVQTTLAPEATELAQAKLDAYLDACTAPATEVPEHCGIRVPWAADLSSLESIAFRIDERPAIELSTDGTAFEATGGVLTATATGASRAGGTGSFTYRADDWAVRGTVAFVGDEMVLSVR